MSGMKRNTRPTIGWLLLACLVISSGCGQILYRVKNDLPDTFVPNPLELPPAEDDFVWSQVIDAVDDYFRIAREQPVQNADGIVLDGRVETSYRIGASVFEPWRKDSTVGFERLQSTLQSIRRRAIVTVRPNGAAYSIEVIVQKDFDLACWGSTIADEAPLFAINRDFNPALNGLGGNFSGYESDTVADLLAGASSAGPDEIQEIVDGIATAYTEDVPMLSLQATSDFILLNPDLDGAKLTVGSVVLFDDATYSG